MKITLGEGVLILLVVILLSLTWITESALRTASANLAQREETKRLQMQLEARAAFLESIMMGAAIGWEWRDDDR